MKAVRSISLAAAVAATAASTCWWGGADCGVELSPWGEMPDLDMHVGDTVETPLTDYFRPVGCIQDGYPGPDGWFVAWSDSAAVAVSVPASSGYRTLTTAAVSVADSVRVTVAVWGSPHHEFLVRVRPPVDGS